MSRHQSLVATSTYVFGGFTGCFWCRDFSPLSRQQLESLQFLFFFQTCHSFKALLLSRPLSPIATSIFVATSRCCRDIIPLVSAQSSATYLVIPVATCIEFLSIFLMSRPHNWTVHTQNCVNESTSCFHFCSAIRLHFCSTYCCIFLLLFLLSFSLPVNNKLVSFFIFLQINCPFLDENQAEKWTKNR